MHRSDFYCIFNRKFNFDDGIVGKALIRGICSFNASGGINVDHSTVAGLVASTIAHEMGHNFGKSRVFMMNLVNIFKTLVSKTNKNY